MPDLLTPDDEQLRKLAILRQIGQPNIPQGQMSLPDAGSIARSGAPPDAGTMQPIATPQMQPIGEPGPIKPLNFHQREALPTTTPQGRLEKLQDEKANPWGTAENHPGTLGKIGHVLGTIGNIAGDVVAPATMANIPGTQMHRDVEEGQLEGQIAGQKKEQFAESQANRNTTVNEQREKSEEPLRAAQTAALENKPDNPADKKVGEYVNGEGKQTVIFQKPDNTTYEKQFGDVNQKELPQHEMGAITLQLPSGQKIAGKKDFQGNLLLADNSPAPQGTLIYQQPNYGQLVLPTKTANIIGSDGMPTVMGWNEKTQKYDIPEGIAGAGAIGHEVGQAGIVQRAGKDLITDIRAHMNDLGTVAAWVEKYGLNTPIADPRLSKLQAELTTFAALQPAMHGFRSHSAMESFQNIIGGLQKNPEATIASIEGILKTAGAINPQGGGQGGDMISVQIPGFPPGQIHKSQLDAFKKDHPDAKVNQ